MTLKVTPVQVVQLNPSMWVVAEAGMQLPGIYANADAALAASALGPELLERLWEHHCPCPMTEAMLMFPEC